MPSARRPNGPRQVVKLLLLLPPLAAEVVDRAEVRGDLVFIWARAAAGGGGVPGLRDVVHGGA